MNKYTITTELTTGIAVTILTTYITASQCNVLDNHRVLLGNGVEIILPGVVQRVDFAQ